MFWLFYFIIFIVLTQIFYGLFVVLYLEIYIIMHLMAMNENFACVCKRNDAASKALGTK